MPRIRSLKYEYFINEDLAQTSLEARLLGLGLTTLADREGRLEDRPQRIKVLLFPYHDVDVEKALSELGAAGFLDRYAVDGKRYIQIVNFLKHQKPHPRETESVIPGHEKVSPRRTKARPSREKETKDSLLENLGDQESDPLVAKVFSTQGSCQTQPGGLGDLCLGDLGSSVSGSGSGEREAGLPFHGEVFLQTWDAFVAHRKKKRAALTERAVELIFEDFRSWGEAKSVQAMKNSIKGNWQGVFEPNAVKQSKAEATMDAVREVVADYEH